MLKNVQILALRTSKLWSEYFSALTAQSIKKSNEKLSKFPWQAKFNMFVCLAGDFKILLHRSTITNQIAFDS